MEEFYFDSFVQPDLNETSMWPQQHTGEKSGSSGESIGDTSSGEDETHQNSYGEGESGEEDCCNRRAEAEDSRRLQGEAWAWEISHHVYTLTSKKRDRERRKNGYYRKMITSDVEKKFYNEYFRNKMESVLWEEVID